MLDQQTANLAITDKVKRVTSELGLTSVVILSAVKLTEPVGRVAVRALTFVIICKLDFIIAVHDVISVTAQL